MQSIRSKDTKPEWIVRKCLHAHGFRYRLHVKSLPGCPDLVLRRYATVVLVQGCFWHGHTPCRIARLPKSNQSWWEAKIKANQERDHRTFFLLKKLGWTVWIIHECELRTATDRAQTLGRLIHFLHGRNATTYPVPQEATTRYEFVEEELIAYGNTKDGL